MKAKIFTIGLFAVLIFTAMRMQSQPPLGYQNVSYTGYYGNYNDVQALDMNTVWLCGDYGSNLIRSTNAGSAWSVVLLSNLMPKNDLYFHDLNNGWVVGDEASVAYTTDGGSNFTEYAFTNYYHHFTGVHFTDQYHGFIVTDTGDVLYTNSGGQTQLAWAFIGFYPGRLNAVHFGKPHAAGTNVAKIGYAVGDNGRIVRIYPMIDDMYSTDSVLSPVSSNLNDVFFTNLTNGVIVGDVGVVLVTNNGGMDWMKLPETAFNPPLPLQTNIKSVCFADENFGWFTTAAGEIYKTYNGGSNWHFQYDAGTSLNAISFYGPRLGFTAGNIGTILKTQTSGDSVYAFFTHSDPVMSTTVTFNNQSSTNANKFLWLWGDGTSSELQNPALHNYLNPGTYTVCLKATDTNAQTTNVYCETMTIGSNTVNCMANFDYFLDMQDTTVHFINQSLGNNLHYLWEFANGRISFEENPVQHFRHQGLHNVKLFIHDSVGNCVDMKRKLVQVGNMQYDCEADFSANNIPATNAVRFFNNSVGYNLHHYLWNFGDGASSNEENPYHIYTEPGIYHVCLTTGNFATNCFNTRCKRINVGSPSNACEADFIYTVVPNSNSVHCFDRSSGNPIIWRWVYGDGTPVGTNQNPLHNYADTGIYPVVLGIANAQGHADFDIRMVNVNSNINTMQVGFAYLQDTSGSKKAAGSVEFRGAAYGDPSRAIWNFGDGSTDSSTFYPIHTYTSPGTYLACMYGYDPQTNQADTFCYNIEVTASINDLNNSNNKDAFMIMPNIITDAATIVMHFNDAQEIELTLTDAMGRLVTVVNRQHHDKGTHQLLWNRNGIPAGIYFLNMKTRNNVITQKIVIQ